MFYGYIRVKKTLTYVTKRFDRFLRPVRHRDACVLNQKIKHKPIDWKHFGSFLIPSPLPLYILTTFLYLKPHGIKRVRLKRSRHRQTVAYLLLYMITTLPSTETKGLKFIICVDSMIKISIKSIQLKINFYPIILFYVSFKISILNRNHQFLSSFGYLSRVIQPPLNYYYLHVIIDIFFS